MERMKTCVTGYMYNDLVKVMNTLEDNMEYVDTSINQRLDEITKRLELLEIKMEELERKLDVQIREIDRLTISIANHMNSNSIDDYSKKF